MDDRYVLEHICTFPCVHRSIYVFFQNTGISKHPQVGCTPKSPSTHVQTLTHADSTAVCPEQVWNEEA